MARYHSQQPAPSPGAVVSDTLEAVAREGARRMLAHALEAEVHAYLGRDRYEPGGRESGYRNGHGRPREIGIGTWSVEVRPPRVSDLPAGTLPFESALLPRRRYLSASTQRLFARLYLEGLSTGDFEPAFRELLGEKAPLSASTIVRLKATWADDYAAWRERPITARYAYVYADGIYLGAGLEEEKSCLLVVIGAREDGAKELLAMGLGYRESTASWADVLRDLRERGLAAPLLAVGDGGLGLWAGLTEVFPSTRHQRCWNHRAMNLVDRLPKRLWPRRGDACGRSGRPRREPSARPVATSSPSGSTPPARIGPPRRSTATGTTSPRSTTSRPSTGSTFGRVTRSSRSSQG